MVRAGNPWPCEQHRMRAVTSTTPSRWIISAHSTPHLALWVTAFLLLCSACGESAVTSPADGGNPSSDGGVSDDGVGPGDAGVFGYDARADDGGSSSHDAGTADRGLSVDAGTPSDGAMSNDGGGLADAAATDNAAMDGSIPRDGASPTDGADSPGGSTDAPLPLPIDLRFEGGSVRKASPLADGALVLIDTPLNLNVDWGFPKRDLRSVDAAGNVRWHVASTADRELLDFAVHPSGEVTALFASAAGFRLVRLDLSGLVLGDLAIIDAAVDTDPPQLPAGVVTGQIETSTHDAGAVAALGEDVIAAVRTARHSVVAHRFAFAAGAFIERSRTLVVPAYSIGAIGLTGGTYDTFGAVDSQFFVQLAVGPDGMIYVGVRHPELFASSLVKSFKDVFAETLVTDPDTTDSYVVRLTADGIRLGTSVVGTDRPDEIFALRAGPGGVWALGRNEVWNAQGTGFDAFIGYVDGATGATSARSLDVDLGDIAFDLAPLTGGEAVVVGASGYAQNPSGASITEGSAAFARWLRADGSVVSVPLPTGPRHNEARFIQPLASGRLLVGGMLDGPGTHSADGDWSLLTAKGFLTEVSLPAP